MRGTKVDGAFEELYDGLNRLNEEVSEYEDNVDSMIDSGNCGPTEVSRLEIHAPAEVLQRITEQARIGKCPFGVLLRSGVPLPPRLQETEEEQE